MRLLTLAGTVACIVALAWDKMGDPMRVEATTIVRFN